MQVMQLLYIQIFVYLISAGKGRTPRNLELYTMFYYHTIRFSAETSVCGYGGSINIIN